MWVPLLHTKVPGVPRAGGSKRHIGGGRVIDASPRAKEWRANVTSFVYEAMVKGAIDKAQGPVSFRLVFYFTRPKSHYRTGKNAGVLKDNAPKLHLQRPDVTKLIRSTEDAITDAGLWMDDCYVVLQQAAKRWAGPHEFQGAVISVKHWVDDDKEDTEHATQATDQL